jgi:alkylation response protein AidB-like acyl-CoA dehydrogenase
VLTPVDKYSSALRRSRDLVPELAARAAATETDGRIHPDSLAALRAAGLFDLPLPERLGGGSGLAETTRVIMEVGRGCPSSAWVLGTSATGKVFAQGGFDDDTQGQIFARPADMFCGSAKPGGTAVPVPGGIRVNGRWNYVSGAEDADVAGLGVLVSGDDGAPPVFRQLVAPADQFTVEHTWDTAGLRGTGSHTLVADDLLVPTERVGAATLNSTLVLSGTAYVLAPVLGAALGALDATEQLFASGGNRFGSTYATIAESPGARQLLTEATQLIEDAVDRTVARCTAFENGEITSALDLARARAAFASAAKDALAALERIADLNGTRGMSRTHSVQRFWRDAAVGARHTLLNQFMLQEELGKLLADPS